MPVRLKSPQNIAPKATLANSPTSSTLAEVPVEKSADPRPIEVEVEVEDNDEWEDSEDEECSICFSMLGENCGNGPACVLSCSHIFHDKCLEKLRTRVCPLCRSALTPRDPDELYLSAMKVIEGIETMKSLMRVLMMDSYPFGDDRREIEEQELEQSCSMLEEAAEQGHVLASFNLAKMYDHAGPHGNGFGFAPDTTRALKWYLHAAKSGHVESMSYFAIIKGKCDCEECLVESFEWHKAAAEAGFKFSFGHLGDCYTNGRGTSMNLTKGIKWYREGALAGNHCSARMLGFVYLSLGCYSNIFDVVRWMKVAVDNGDEDGGICCFYLGELYAFAPIEEKLQECAILLEKNAAESMKWYKQSASCYLQPAMELLRSIRKKHDEQGPTVGLAASVLIKPELPSIGPAQLKTGFVTDIRSGCVVIKLDGSDRSIEVESSAVSPLL